MDSALTPGAGGLGRITLHAPGGARADVYAHGAHVTSWVPAGERSDRLFLSERSAFQDGAAIRGGVPVIFPQFAHEGPLPRHGFARDRAWALAGTSGASATFHLEDTPETHDVWPHAFRLTLAVTINGRSLVLALTAENTGLTPFAFAAALHTYLRVERVEAAVVRGLQGCAYRDSAAGGSRSVQAEPSLSFRGEVDRVYLDVPGPLDVEEPGRALRVEAAGFPDAVVWNPGAGRAAALADLESGGWARFVCVEAAAVEVPVQLGPGETWAGTQTLTAL